jgi:hypothetical protein
MWKSEQVFRETGELISELGHWFREPEPLIGALEELLR